MYGSLLPSESDRISEDFHFNVVNVGFVFDVPTTVVHNNIKTKIFFIPLIMCFLTNNIGYFEGFSGVPS